MGIKSLYTFLFRNGKQLFQQIYKSNLQMYDQYNTIENHQWIPKEAFLYFPNGQSAIKQEDDYKRIFRNQIKRLIYEGGIEYVEEENQKIQAFRMYIAKKEVVLGNQWSKAYLYKFLQSTGYDEKRALKQILSHNQYQRNLHSKDFEELRKTVEPLLKKGPLYFNGRDAKYRPITVCDIAKIHSMKLSETEFNMCLQYFFEFLYRNMLICGQAENIVGIIDVGGISPIDLLKPMKMTISFLQGNYKYKLHAMYIIRSTGMFQMAYNIAKQFMKEDTIRKVNVIEKENTVLPLFEYTNPMQVEKRFGGTHQNLKQGEFWPPQFFGDDYSHPLVQRKIITEAEYKQLYEGGHLPGRKIYLDFVKEGSQQQNQIPILNSKPPSVKEFTENNIKSEHKRNKNLFERAVNKLSCYGCFGDKDNKQLRKKHKHKNNM